MHLSTLATRSSFQRLESAPAIAASIATTSDWAPRASCWERSMVSSVLVRTCQNRPNTLSMGSWLTSHWYSIWNAHSRARVLFPIR